MAPTKAAKPSSREIEVRAIAGRLAFLLTLVGLLYAAFFTTPRVFVSTHVAHFAGFYIFAFACASAAKRVDVIPLGCCLAALAVLVELARALVWLPLSSSYLDWVGDLAGIVGALAPMLLQKVRSEFGGGPR